MITATCACGWSSPVERLADVYDKHISQADCRAPFVTLTCSCGDNITTGPAVTMSPLPSIADEKKWEEQHCNCRRTKASRAG